MKMFGASWRFGLGVKVGLIFLFGLFQACGGDYQSEANFAQKQALQGSTVKPAVCALPKVSTLACRTSEFSKQPNGSSAFQIVCTGGQDVDGDCRIDYSYSFDTGPSSGTVSLDEKTGRVEYLPGLKGVVRGDYFTVQVTEEGGSFVPVMIVAK